MTFFPPVVESEFSILEFTVRRFMHDLGMFMSEAMKEPVIVAPSTHTEYFDTTQGFHIQVPDEIMTQLESGKTKAKLPAITVGDINDFRNSVRTSSGKRYVPTTIVGSDGQPIESAHIMNPLTYWDISLSVRVYADDPRVLILMKRLIFQYFDIHPYLFIPSDLTNTRGVTNPPTLSNLITQWWNSDTPELDPPGIFITQGFEDSSILFTSNATATMDNILTADATLLLEEIPVSDMQILNTHEYFKTSHVIICDWADEDRQYEVMDTSS